jgi:hypothetical protein
MMGHWVGIQTILSVCTMQIFSWYYGAVTGILIGAAIVCLSGFFLIPAVEQVDIWGVRKYEPYTKIAPTLYHAKPSQEKR